MDDISKSMQHIEVPDIDPPLLFAKTQALHSYYNAQNDIRWLYFSASNLFSSMGYYYNKFDFFQGLKTLKKVLKNLEKKYFKSSIDP